jgi:hypothetical protein
MNMTSSEMHAQCPVRTDGGAPTTSIRLRGVALQLECSESRI